MNILGIDYGEKKIGIAFADSSLADPLMVIKYQTLDYLIEKLKKIIKEKNIKKAVLGVSEGKMAKNTLKFGNTLKEKLGIEIEYEDETLSSQEAQSLARLANLHRAKRKELEDAFAATIILQNYLDKIISRKKSSN
jgi:putative Holliday junction resolvase